MLHQQLILQTRKCWKTVQKAAADTPLYSLEVQNNKIKKSTSVKAGWFSKDNKNRYTNSELQQAADRHCSQEDQTEWIQTSPWRWRSGRSRPSDSAAPAGSAALPCQLRHKAADSQWGTSETSNLKVAERTSSLSVEALCGDGVDLVNEDDGGSVLLGQPKDVSDHAGAFTQILLNELGAHHADEGSCGQRRTLILKNLHTRFLLRNNWSGRGLNL